MLWISIKMYFDMLLQLINTVINVEFMFGNIQSGFKKSKSFGDFLCEIQKDLAAYYVRILHM